MDIPVIKVMGHFSAKRDFDIQYKVTIVGNSGVGKTSVLQTLTGFKHENQYLPTIGEHTLVFFENEVGRL